MCKSTWLAYPVGHFAKIQSKNQLTDCFNRFRNYNLTSEFKIDFKSSQPMKMLDLYASPLLKYLSKT